MAKYHRKKQASSSGFGNLLAQLGRALVGLWRVAFGSKRAGRFNRVQLLAQYAQIEQLIDSGDTIHAAQAVVRADSFLDGVMKQAGGQGSSFGERLRSLEGEFDRSLYQQLWDAHKLRNRIAHEHPQISVGQARSALQAFRRAASQLGAF